MKKLKKILPFLFLLLVFIPVFVSAQGGIIPCGGWNYDNNGNRTTEQSPCGYDDLLQLVSNIINWIIMVSVPVAAGVFAWVGFTYMTTGVSDKKSEAKKMLGKVFWGFVFILGAYLIVETILAALT
ncbi:MAG: pilin [Patescibacteria group bacterium]